MEAGVVITVHDITNWLLIAKRHLVVPLITVHDLTNWSLTEGHMTLSGWRGGRSPEVAVIQILSMPSQPSRKQEVVGDRT